jgi:hypothetical protein
MPPDPLLERLQHRQSRLLEVCAEARELCVQGEQRLGRLNAWPKVSEPLHSAGVDLAVLTKSTPIANTQHRGRWGLFKNAQTPDFAAATLSIETNAYRRD